MEVRRLCSGIQSSCIIFLDSVFHSCSPIKSIKDIGSLVTPVWKLTAGVVGSQSKSLDDIEDFLRDPSPFKYVQ